MKTVLRAWDARIAKLDTFEGADGKTAFVRLITSDGIEGRCPLNFVFTKMLAKNDLESLDD